MANSQITVRTRDCQGCSNRPVYIGEILPYMGQDWVVVGLFVGADPITREAEEHLVLEGVPTDELGARERGKQRESIF